MAAIKHLFIFDTSEGPDGLAFVADHTASLVDVRKAIRDLPDGEYLILEDTSGVITKKTTPRTDVDVTFDPPRKRARKAKESKE